MNVPQFTGDRPTIQFTRPKLAALKRRYTQAVKQNEEQFTFEGHILLTAYAKYLVEYLETQLNERRHKNESSTFSLS